MLRESLLYHNLQFLLHAGPQITHGYRTQRPCENILRYRGFNCPLVRMLITCIKTDADVIFDLISKTPLSPRTVDRTIQELEQGLAHYHYLNMLHVSSTPTHTVYLSQIVLR